MEINTSYFIQAGIVLLTLYLFYRFVLRSQPTLLYNRVYLLLAPLLAFAIPLLRVPLPIDAVLPATDALPTIALQEVLVVGNTPVATDTPHLSLSVLALGIYLAVAVLLLTRLVTQLIRIRRLVADAVPVKTAVTDARLLQTEEATPTFAFLNLIFLGKPSHLSEQEQQQVLAHELAHVRLRHTYDVLYYELLTILLWFNPLVWLLKQELRDVHEYQADAEVLSVCQPQEYTSLLAKEALYANGIPVGSYFHKPQILKRLQMIQLHGSKGSQVRPLLAIPLLLLMLISFSTSKASTELIDSLESPTSITELLVTAPARKPGTALDKPSPQQLETEPKATPTFSSPKPEPGKPARLKMEERAKQPEQPITTTEEKVYTYVEEMPAFLGGEAEMLKFLGRNVRYPKDAQEAGVEGLVVLSFVVERDGSLSNIAIVKSLHSTTDQEAIRVVQNMNGKWTPGKQNGREVPVRYTLPVRFAIK